MRKRRKVRALRRPMTVGRARAKGLRAASNPQVVAVLNATAISVAPVVYPEVAGSHEGTFAAALFANFAALVAAVAARWVPSDKRSGGVLICCLIHLIAFFSLEAVRPGTFSDTLSVSAALMPMFIYVGLVSQRDWEKVASRIERTAEDERTRRRKFRAHRYSRVRQDGARWSSLSRRRREGCG